MSLLGSIENLYNKAKNKITQEANQHVIQPLIQDYKQAAPVIRAIPQAAQQTYVQPIQRAYQQAMPVIRAMPQAARQVYVQPFQQAYKASLPVIRAMPQAANQIYIKPLVQGINKTYVQPSLNTFNLQHFNVPKPVRSVVDFAQDTAKSVPRAPIRLAGQLALDISNYQTRKDIAPDAYYKPQSKIGKFVFGSEPIASSKERSKINQQFGKDIGLPSKIAGPLGIGMAMAGSLTDASMAGGAKKKVSKEAAELAAKNLAKEEAGTVAKQGVLKILEGTVPKERGFITSVKESVKTPSQIKSKIVSEYLPQTEKQLQSIAKKVIRDNPTSAEGMALNPQSAVHVAVGNELINRHLAVGNFAKAQQIVEGMASSGTEFGQAVQAFSQYDKTTPAGALKFAQKTIDEYNRANPTKKLKISSDQVQGLFNRAKAIQVMPEGRERNIASNYLMKEVSNLIPSSVASKAVTVWKAGLLTSLRTTARNIIGNAVHGAAEVSKDVVSAPIDMALAARTGRRSMSLTTQGLKQGTGRGFEAAWDTMKHGFDPEEAINKYDVKHITWGKNPVEQALKKYTDFVFNWMGAQDKPFYHASFARSLYDQAGAEAINAGRRGDKAFIERLVKNPTEEMKTIATQDASVAVFKDKNKLTQLANSIKSKGGPLADYLMPFTGVPSSIAGQMVNYSPIGLVKGIADAGKVFIRPNQIPGLQRQAAQEIGRGVIGSGLISIGAHLTSKGLMSGQPKDAAEARQWELEGKQANSVFVNGKWRSINSIGPEALVILAGSKVAATGLIGETAAGIGKDFMSQTFLQGIQQPLQALSDPGRYGANYFKSQAGSLIPNMIKDIAKSGDKTQRETNSVVDTLKSGIPALRNTLLPKRDALGQPLTNETSGYKAFIDLFNSKTPSTDPVVRELSRLSRADYSATPSKLDKTQTINKQKFNLTPEELNTLTGQGGTEIKNQMLNVMQTQSYQESDDETRQKLLKNVVEEVRKQAKAGFLENKIPMNAETPEGAYGKAGAAETGISPPPPQTKDTEIDYSSIKKFGSKYSAIIDGEFKTFSKETDAKKAIEKFTFDQSGLDYQVVGDTIYYRNESGGISTKTRQVQERETRLAQIYSELDTKKRANDYEGWRKLQEERLSTITDQLNELDPNNPIEAEKIASLKNTSDDILSEVDKYDSYGGAFKKGKSSASVQRTKNATINADYTLQSDRLERANDMTGWLALQEQHLQDLVTQSGQATTQAQAIAIQTKAENLVAKIEQVKAQGGLKAPPKPNFTKPKMVSGPKTAKVRVAKPKIKIPKSIKIKSTAVKIHAPKGRKV